MRRPIRSNVIQRRMFNGGMGMTKPGAPVASGILASSQPLVDVLANQARDNLTNGINVGSQMYGSNVQGTNLMNKGGVANYAPGGFGSNPKARISLGGNEELLKRLVPSTEYLNRRNYPPGVTYPTARSMYQYSGKDISSEEYPNKNYVDLPGRGKNEGKSRFQQALDYINPVYNVPLNAPLSGIAQFLTSGRGNENETGFNVADDFSTASPMQLSTIDALLSMNKGREREILAAAKKVITVQGSTEDGVGLKEQINDVLNETPAAPTEEELALLEAEKLEEEKRPVDLGDLGMSEVAPKTTSSGEVVEGTVIDEKDSDKIILGDVEVTGESDTEETTTEETAPDDPYDFTDKDLYDAFGANVVDDVRANSDDKVKTKLTLEQYKEEFKNAMPEYQGMSDEEKGNAWIKMGMAVAAGQSANAITNIANGVLATIDEFADDPKQKREYEMKVALAASKYAIENVNSERTVLREFEKNEQDLVMIFNPDTQEQKTITKADLRAGNVPVGFMVTQDPLGDAIKLMNAQRDLVVANTALIEAKKPDEITDKWAKMGTNYQDAALKVIDSVQSKTLLGPAIEMLYDPNTSLVGLESGMKTVWNRVTNAIGLTENDLPGKKEGEANEEYVARVQGVIAKKITAILGESNRTISTSDRDRADELAGVFANYWIDKTITDPDVLKIKIKNLWTTLDNDERQGRATMNRIVRDVGNKAVPGGKEGSFAQSLMLTQQELFEGKPVIGEEGNVVDYLDMFDLKGNLLK